MANNITAQEAHAQILAQLRDRPYAHAYKGDDGLWSVIVFSGQGDEQFSVSDLDDEAFAPIKPLCAALNIEDDGSQDNPDYNPKLIDGDD